MAALNSANMLRDYGSPLDLQVNDVRRVSCVPYRNNSGTFEGRKTSSVGSLGRKPSAFPADLSPIEGSTASDRSNSINTAELAVGERRRLSSVPFRHGSDAFEGRKQPSVGSLGRKPSLTPSDPIPGCERSSPNTSKEMEVQVKEKRRGSIFGSFGRKQSAVPSSSSEDSSTAPSSEPTLVERADDDPDDYIIQRLANHDEIEHMSRWKRWLYVTVRFWGGLSHSKNVL